MLFSVTNTVTSRHRRAIAVRSSNDSNPLILLLFLQLRLCPSGIEDGADWLTSFLSKAAASHIHAGHLSRPVLTGVKGESMFAWHHGAMALGGSSDVCWNAVRVSITEFSSLREETF